MVLSGTTLREYIHFNKPGWNTALAQNHQNRTEFHTYWISRHRHVVLVTFSVAMINYHTQAHLFGCMVPESLRVFDGRDTQQPAAGKIAGSRENKHITCRHEAESELTCRHEAESELTVFKPSQPFPMTCFFKHGCTSP